MDVTQEFQKVVLNIKEGNTSLKVDSSWLTGNRLCFTAINLSNNNKYVYSGRVDGENITGNMQIHQRGNGIVDHWTAVRE